MDLAHAAFRRATELTPFGTPVMGIAATCALASEPPKRGEHRAYLAAHNGEETRVTSLRLAKGARSRWLEDGVVSRLLLRVSSMANLVVCGRDDNQQLLAASCSDLQIPVAGHG